MAYTPQTWANNDPTTPLSAARLNYMEAGIAASGTSGARPTTMLGVVGHSSPALSDFTAFNTAISPRTVDIIMFMQGLDTEPLWYGSYETWATSLNAILFSTISSGTHTANYYVTSGNDSSGLNSGGIAGLAATAVAWGKPVIVRPFHEFNGNWNSYGYTKETAAQFVAGWKHLVDVFRANNAYNVLWCWGPNVWGDVTEIDPTAADGSGVNWYPGDDYVDLIGLDGYMMTEAASVLTPEQLFLSNYNSLVAAFPNKPFCIPEVGVAKDSRLAGAVGGKAGWYNLFFKMVREKMPKALFVVQWERTDGVDDTTISSSGLDSAAAAAFVKGVGNPPFISSPISTPNSQNASTTTIALATETTRATTAEALLAPKASPTLTGVPLVPTATALTNTTQAASTAYADAAVAVEASARSTADALLAPKASPPLTGSPTINGASIASQATAVGQPILTSSPVYGAVCDATTLGDAIITTGTATVAHASGAFTNADIGKLYVLNGGGAAINSAAVLSGTLGTGSPITSLPVTALGAAFPGGALTITESGHTQQFLCAGAATGATSLPVTSLTPNFAYTAAATIKSWAAPLYTTILSVQSTAAITLATNALSTLTSTYKGEAVYGTDNATVLQTAMTAAQGKQLLITAGPGEGYMTSQTLVASAGITIKGLGCVGLFGPISTLDGQNYPQVAPYLQGSVIIVAAAATDGIQFTGAGTTVNLDGFGVRFAGKWVNTGDGLKVLPPITASTFRDMGVSASSWKGLRVFGHDGNHYAYTFTNSVANMDDSLQSWGGGGIHHFQNSQTTGQYGNHTSTQQMAYMCVGSAAHGLYVDNTAPGASGVFNMFRFHGHHLHFDQSHTNIPGAILPTSTQFMYQTNGNVDKVTHVGIEGNGGVVSQIANFVLPGSGSTFGHGAIAGSGGAITNYGTGQNSTPTTIFKQQVGTLLLYTMIWDMLVSPIASADIVFNESAASDMSGSVFPMAQSTVPANSTAATATLSGTVQVSDGARTTLPVNAVPGVMLSGSWVTVYNGSIAQQWKVDADAAAGATTLTVASQTPNGTYVSTNGVYQAVRVTLSSFLMPGWYYQAVATNAKFISRQSVGVAGS